MNKLNKMSSTFSCELITIKRISSRASHSAFCDLLDTSDNLIACYRQATNHVSADGRIETQLITKEGLTRHRQHLWFDGVDLRDPKLSYLPDGRILLIAYARHTGAGNKTKFARSVYWTSQDGMSWSSPRYFGPKNWWLWRLTWFEGKAYGFAYNRAAQQIDLYAGNPLGNIECVKAGVLSKAKHGYGYPNESDIWFENNGRMHAIVRRDADSYSALHGMSTFPYTQWTWQDLRYYVGGPKVLPIKSANMAEHILVCGRVLSQKGLKTCLWQLSDNKQKLLPRKVLPSGGDTSYPGMVYKNNVLNILYYSSHIDNQSRVYLANFTLGIV